MCALIHFYPHVPSDLLWLPLCSLWGTRRAASSFLSYSTGFCQQAVLDDSCSPLFESGVGLWARQAFICTSRPCSISDTVGMLLLLFGQVFNPSWVWWMKWTLATPTHTLVDAHPIHFSWMKNSMRVSTGKASLQGKAIEQGGSRSAPGANSHSKS